MNSKNIIFVYNAKGGKWNYILDTVHKYASPSTYDCNLCKITYNLKMRGAWKKFIEGSKAGRVSGEVISNQIGADDESTRKSNVILPPIQSEGSNAIILTKKEVRVIMIKTVKV